MCGSYGQWSGWATLSDHLLLWLAAYPLNAELDLCTAELSNDLRALGWERTGFTHSDHGTCFLVACLNGVKSCISVTQFSAKHLWHEDVPHQAASDLYTYNHFHWSSSVQITNWSTTEVLLHSPLVSRVWVMVRIGYGQEFETWNTEQQQCLREMRCDCWLDKMWGGTGYSNITDCYVFHQPVHRSNTDPHCEHSESSANTRTGTFCWLFNFYSTTIMLWPDLFMTLGV